MSSSPGGRSSTRSKSRTPSPIHRNGDGEEILFNEANGRDGFALRPGVKKIDIVPSGQEQMNESSPFHFTTVVDYQWDTHYNYGRLIATHLTSKFIAYVVKVTNVGAVRVIDMDTKERVLMKGDKGLIKDVDFLHKPEDIVIGFIDEYGTVYVNKIIKELKSGKISTTSLIKVTMDGSPLRSENRRFIWCKYVPDEVKELTSPKDCAYHFAVLQNDVIYASNLVQFVHRKGEGPFQFIEVRNEFLIIDAHSSAVTDASFAPDGTALATASKDGTVKFFQIYFQDHNEPARCLFSWAPHDGRPVDKIFFLDNHTVRDSPPDSQYWKFMITASENMSELKLYTCKTWECLQVLNFTSEKSSQWKIEMDLSGQYLVATDIHKKAMYMLHLENDEENARFHWIREFSMPWTVISFNISSANCLKPEAVTKRGHGLSIVGDQATFRDDDELNLLEINVVQPRSLQQGSVAVKAPEFFCRSNGHHRISFNNDVAYRNINPLSETTSTAPPQDHYEEVLNLEEDEEINLQAQSESELQLVPGTRSMVSLTSPKGSRSGSFEPERSISSGKCRSTSSVSPHLITNPKEVPSVAEMSEQLSSLIGLGLGRKTSSTRSNTSSKGKSGSPHSLLHGVTGGRVPLDLRDETLTNLHHGGTNGNIGVSKTSASSSPSREVEEILSPKNGGNFVGQGTIVMNAGIVLDAFENGNIGPPTVLKSPLFKSKAMSETELCPQIPQVLDKVNSLVDMMVMQATEIKELKKEVSRLTIMHGASLKTGEEGVAMSSSFDKHFKQNQLQLNRLEEVLRSIDSSEKQRTTSLQQQSASIPSNLAEVLATSIGSIVKAEIQTLIPHTMDRMFDPARLQVNTQIERLTSIVEAKLTQNIAQIMQKEKIWQNLTADFHSITKAVFESCFNDLFMNAVFPRCQNAIQELLTQVNNTFMRGTKEYLSGLEGVLDRERKRDDLQDLVRDQINAMQDTLSSTLQVEIEAQMLRVLGGLQSGVVRNIEDSMARELSRAFKEQQRYFEISVIPRTATPAVSLSDHHLGGSLTPSDPAIVQRNLLALARSGDLFNAFVQASNHGNVDVLLHLCKDFNPSAVFDCKLPTHVHVSIMHLLALDIMEDTETKLSYLHGGLGSLDMSDRKTLKSVARMIPVFQAAVGKYLERNSDSKYHSMIKLLEMAFNGIGMQLKSPSTPSQQSQHSFSQY